MLVVDLPETAWRRPQKRSVVNRLERAAKLIEDGNWTSDWRKANEASDAIDLLKAIHWRAYTDRAYDVAYEVEDAVHAVLEHEDGGHQSLTMWNDSQRDKRKVVRLLRRTARMIRENKLVYKDSEYGWEVVE